MRASFHDLLGKALQVFVTSLTETETLRYKDAVKATPKNLFGVYLIYDAQGVLLYVGESENVRSRLHCHCAAGSVLVNHLLNERGHHERQERGHVCACGTRIKCSSGLELPSQWRKTVDAIRREIKETYRVRVLAGPLQELLDGKSRRGVESFVHWLLRPKYSSWRDPEYGRRWLKLPPELPFRTSETEEAETGPWGPPPPILPMPESRT